MQPRDRGMHELPVQHRRTVLRHLRPWVLRERSQALLQT
jgi:hypothetical protein